MSSSFHWYRRHFLLLWAIGFGLAPEAKGFGDHCELLSILLQHTGPYDLSAEEYRAVFGGSQEAVVARMKAAQDAVLGGYSPSQRQAVSSPLSFQELTQVSLEWEESLDSLQNLPSFSPGKDQSALKPLSRDVFQFVSEGKTYVLRWIEGVTEDEDLWAARRAFLAAQIDQAIGFDVIPNSFIGRVNSRIAVIAPFIDGQMVANQRGQLTTKFIANLLRQGVLKKEAWWIAQAVVFLTGNDDSDGTNLIHTADGRILHIDQGIALSYGTAITLESKILDLLPLGFVLPEYYPKSFIARLSGLSLDYFDDLLFDSTSEEEFARFAYRRDLILADAALRPGAVLE